MKKAEAVLAAPLNTFVEEVLGEYENVDVVTTRIAGRTYVTVKELGFSLVSEDSESVVCVQVHGKNSGYGPSVISLPKGLSMSDVRVDFHRKLGPPSQSGGGGRNPLNGSEIPLWEVFIIGKDRCHVEYLPRSDEVALVSLELAKIP